MGNDQRIHSASPAPVNDPPPSHRKIEARQGVLKRIGHWSDRMLLRSVPEYQLFQSEEARLKAIMDLDVKLEGSASFWRAVAVISIAGTVLANASLFIVPMMTRWRVPIIGWSVSEMTAVLVVVMSIAAIVWVWRMGVARRLREKLIESGVPVCRECGSLLRGLSVSDGGGRASLRCPECGWEADEVVIALNRRG